MAITLPDKFKADIQGRDTNLIPIVRIGNEGSEDPHIFISTNSGATEGGFLKPLLLNIPSLKESIDIESRHYKIASVNLDISNIPYEGKRFSELAMENFPSSSSLINKECRIWWASPSSSIPYTTMGDNTDSALLIYYGIIRKYDYGDKKVRIILEDKSESVLHRPMPANRLDDSSDVPDKYKNKPYPLVFGSVDKSPCVVGEGLVNGETKIFCDVMNSGTMYEIAAHNPLFIYHQDQYVEVEQHAGIGFTADLYSHHGYANREGEPPTSQYSRSSSTTDITFPIDSFDSAGQVASPVAENKVMVRTYDTPIDDKWFSNEDDYIGPAGSAPLGVEASSGPSSDLWQFFFPENDEPDLATTFYLYYSDANATLGTPPKFRELRHQFKFSPISPTSDTDPLNPEKYDVFLQYNFNYNMNLPTVSASSWTSDSRTEFHIDPVIEEDLEQTSIFTTQDPIVENSIESQQHYFLPAGSQNETSQTFHLYAGGTSFAEAAFTINSIARNAYYIIDNFIESDFYATVRGRRYANTSEMAQSFQHIISSILNQELGQPFVDVIPSDYDGWNYGFTVNEIIQSKKLIENFSSASPYLTHYDSSGKFKINQIPAAGGVLSDLGGNEYIKQDDVIDFSFSRTPIEDVKTKITFKYDWDYGREEFNRTLDIGIHELIVYPTFYDHTYYDLPNDDSESTLIVEDERGKFIRNIPTAISFAKWLLLWHCNQHLKIKTRLPLKYMNLEVGDIVQFDSILGDITPFGIKYNTVTTSGDPAFNGQIYYNHFMVISTNKTLEYCDVEVIQLHSLAECEVDGVPGEYDCAGICGGDTVADICGTCGGIAESGEDCPCDNLVEGQIPCNPPWCNKILDCEGECNYPGQGAVLDACNECGGDGSACSGCMQPGALTYNVDYTCCPEAQCLWALVLGSCCGFDADDNSCHNMLVEAGWDPNSGWYEDHPELLIDASAYSIGEEFIAAREAFELAGGMDSYEELGSAAWLAGGIGSSRPVIYTSQLSLCEGMGTGEGSSIFTTASMINPAIGGVAYYQGDIDWAWEPSFWELFDMPPFFGYNEETGPTEAVSPTTFKLNFYNCTNWVGENIAGPGGCVGTITPYQIYEAGLIYRRIQVGHCPNLNLPCNEASPGFVMIHTENFIYPPTGSYDTWEHETTVDWYAGITAADWFYNKTKRYWFRIDTLETWEGGGGVVGGVSYDTLLTPRMEWNMNITFSKYGMFGDLNANGVIGGDDDFDVWTA